MKHKKIAFTLIEIMIVLGMVGMIIIFATQILMGRINQYSSSYTNIYRALQKASYNILADIHCPKNNSENLECCLIEKNPSCLAPTRPFPMEQERIRADGKKFKGHEEICERLKEYLNATNSNEGKCEAMPVVDGNITESNLKFVSSNGMRFYNSDVMTYEVVKTEDKNGDGDFNDPGEKITDEVKYYIIYVDINGDSKPDSVEPVGDYLPDIVPFAITSRGETIPLGLPTILSTYLTAKIKFPAIEAEVAGEIDERQYSKSMTFEEAVYGAWKDDANFDIPYSFNINYDDANKDNIALGKKGIDKFAGMDKETRIKKRIENNDNNDVYYEGAISYDGKYGGCQSGTFNCRVIIDTETTRRF
ncbi:MAG: type II secretion system protein [Candidatus Gastranaerophilales bacterium]|nr:type II secretion system protein [Candidatus Gastranaerophilales bacterium]